MAAEAHFRQVYDKGMAQAAESAFQLGALAESRIDYATAQKYYSDALRLRPDDAEYLEATGGIAFTLGQYAKAEPLYLQALEIHKKALGPEHPRVATGLNNPTELYREQGHDVKAEPLYLQALEIHKKALGPEHPDVAIDLNNLGELYRGKTLNPAYQSSDRQQLESRIRRTSPTTQQALVSPSRS